MKKLLLAIISLIIVSSSFSAYYADVVINVERDGLVSISGLTNHPNLSVTNVEYYTMKEGDYWLLNISLPEEFSNYVYEVVLPENSVINYLSTPSIMNIKQLSNNLIITAIGDDESFKAVVQYKLESNNVYYYYLFLIPLIGLIFYLIIRKKRKKSKINYNILTDRQSKIINLIEKSDGITQKRIEELVDFPKAAVSRNIQTLVNKGFITKHKKGVTNLLFLKK